MLRTIKTIIPPDDFLRTLGVILRYLLDRHGKVPRKRELPHFLRRILAGIGDADLRRHLEGTPWLSEEAREATDTHWLFRFKEPWVDSTAFADFQFGEAVNQFARYVEVPPLPDGSVWLFAAHQFRRFFGIVHFWRFKFPSLTALSNFYGHYDADKTRAYVSDSAHGRYLRDAEDHKVDAQTRKLARRAQNDAQQRADDFERTRLDFVMKRLERWQPKFAIEAAASVERVQTDAKERGRNV
jgi:hypothetical protein